MALLSRGERRLLLRVVALGVAVFVIYHLVQPSPSQLYRKQQGRQGREAQPDPQGDDTPGLAGLGDDAPGGAPMEDAQQAAADLAEAGGNPPDDGAAVRRNRPPGAHMDRDVTAYGGASHTRMHGAPLGVHSDGTPGWVQQTCPGSDVNMRKELLGNGFYARLSDCLPLDRDIPDWRHPMCKDVQYDLDTLPTTSVIFVFYNVSTDGSGCCCCCCCCYYYYYCYVVVVMGSLVLVISISGAFIVAAVAQVARKAAAAV